MKKLLIVVLVTLGLLTFPKVVSAQSCSGSIVICGSQEVSVCTNASGNTCDPKDYGCNCVTQCAGTTFTCNSCADAYRNGGCSPGYACSGVAGCLCVKSGFCNFTPATPTPSPAPGSTPPPAADACNNRCVPPAANCGVYGYGNGSGTCSGGQ
ncbi:MAG: hypothetical protein AAB656_00235, partial [Patescibacteria group bacterium]